MNLICYVKSKKGQLKAEGFYIIIVNLTRVLVFFTLILL
jgi:hypothetical protein